MNKKVFPQLGEQYFEQRLENGMVMFSPSRKMLPESDTTH